jgi:hypothetical protein
MLAQEGKAVASVFVSFASRDSERVSDTLAELRERGLVTGTDVVTDQVFVPGSSLRGTLRKAIQDASSIVVLWTEAAAQSANVNYEIGMADALGKPIMIVDLDGRRRVPADLGNVQVVDLHSAA